MASGLVALLDDVAAIAKLSAASLDDVAGAAGKAGSKAVGVVVDDAAVTPGYAMGFSPDRELPIVAKIAAGSLANKFVLLLPGALLLSAFAPWAVTPILMLGGSYLCFEAAEKIIEAFTTHEDAADHPETLAQSSAAMEKEKVFGAIRTDLILSAEIMAIALSQVAGRSLGIQAAALAVVALALTVGVYGVVALIVKMDDIGLHLAQGRSRAGRGLGRGMVKAMPVVMEGLARIGTAAMLWVGGGLVIHGLHHYHVEAIPNLVGALSDGAAVVPGLGPVAAWIVTAAASGLVGLALGGLIALAVHRLGKH